MGGSQCSDSRLLSGLTRMLWCLDLILVTAVATLGALDGAAPLSTDDLGEAARVDPSTQRSQRSSGVHVLEQALDAIHEQQTSAAYSLQKCNAEVVAMSNKRLDDAKREAGVKTQLALCQRQKQRQARLHEERDSQLTERLRKQTEQLHGKTEQLAQLSQQRNTIQEKTRIPNSTENSTLAQDCAAASGAKLTQSVEFPWFKAHVKPNKALVPQTKATIKPVIGAPLALKPPNKPGLGALARIRTGSALATSPDSDGCSDTHRNTLGWSWACSEPENVCYGLVNGQIQKFDMEIGNF